MWEIKKNFEIRDLLKKDFYLFSKIGLILRVLAKEPLSLSHPR